MKFVFHLFVLTFITFATPTFADQERFDKALELWLDAENETAYPLLSELAYEGYEPAMLFLGGLYVQQSNNGFTYLRVIPEEYSEFIISSNGGENWLDHVVEDSEFAQAISKWHVDRISDRDFAETLVNLSIKSDAAMQRGLILAEHGEFAHTANIFFNAVQHWRPSEDEAMAFLAQDFSDYIKPVQWFIGSGMAHRRPMQPIIQTLVASEIAARLFERKLNALYFYDQYLHTVDRDYHDPSFPNFSEKLQDFIDFGNSGFFAF